MQSYVKDSIPVYYDEKFYKKTEYHKIDPKHPEMTTKMFKVMKGYKFPNDDRVFWILSNKSLTQNNIRFLENEGWYIVGIEAQGAEIELCKQDFGTDQANLKLTIKKMNIK
jgi:hypothetical protein